MNQKTRVVCDECKHEFFLNAVDIESAEVKSNDQRLVLTYFKCPKCNKIYRVLLADTCYFELKEDVEKTKEKIQKIFGSNDAEKARVLNQMVNRKLQRLRNHVDKLNAMFPGSFVLVTSENNCKKKIIKYLP